MVPLQAVLVVPRLRPPIIALPFPALSESLHLLCNNLISASTLRVPDPVYCRLIRGCSLGLCWTAQSTYILLT